MKPSEMIKQPTYKGKDAETIKDIVKTSGLSETTVRRHARKMIDVGRWKEVIVKEKHSFTKAYIVIK